MVASLCKETAPDTISYNACINACETGGLWQAALHLFESMNSRNLPQHSEAFVRRLVHNTSRWLQLS